MALIKEEIILLSDAIHQAFEKPDDLTDFLNKYENIKGKLVLKINYANLPDDKILANLNIFNQNSEKYKLLIIEASNTQGLNFEGETSGIISQIHNNPCIQYEENNDKVIVKNSFKMQQTIFKKNYQICHIFGHGSNSGIIFTEQEGIETEKLKALLKYQKHYQCFIFNICHSETIAKEVSTYIDYAIGMTQAINDQVAIEFARGFYLGLKNGIDNNQDIFLRGFREGIQAISRDRNSQKSIPVLYINYKQAILNLIKQLDAEDKIEDFLTQLKTHHPTNVSLCNFISRFYHPLKDNLNRFKSIFQQITDNSDIQTAYQKIFPDDIESNKDKIIDKLIINSQQNSQIPLIVQFANHLAEILDKHKNEKDENYQFQHLRKWLNGLPDEFKISNQEQPNQTQVKTDLWIIVDYQDNQLCLEALVMEEGKNIKEDLKALNLTGCEDEKGIRCDCFEKIPFKIDEIIDAYEKNEYKLKTTTIELFLPMCHIENNIFYDWIQHDFEETMTCCLIREKQIRIHLNERRKKVNYYHLERRYKEYQDLNQSKSFTPNGKIGTINENVNKKNLEMLVSQLNGKFGVKLCTKHKKNQIQYFFSVILKAGTFLIFWLKYSSPENLSLNQIDNLLFSQDYLNNNNDDYFQKIIGEMHNLIRDDNSQLNPKECLGYHLGFLCDNPYRIPESKHLKKF